MIQNLIRFALAFFCALEMIILSPSFKGIPPGPLILATWIAIIVATIPCSLVCTAIWLLLNHRPSFIRLLSWNLLLTTAVGMITQALRHQ